jgi:hypothetical protein
MSSSTFERQKIPNAIAQTSKNKRIQHSFFVDWPLEISLEFAVSSVARRAKEERFGVWSLA